MAIHEESFRMGSGRYIQGAGYIDKCGEELKRYGSTPLIIGGKTAFSVSKEKIEASVSKVCDKYKFVIHMGNCNDDDAKYIATCAKEEGYDIIIGVGGGKIMDFAKLCAYFASLPIINIPTQSATCAAFTPLSVRYTKEGKTVGTTHFEYEVNSVIVDTEIIAAQPARIFLSGVFDALAKFVEIKHRYSEDSDSYALGLDFAFALAKRSYTILTDKTQKCINDMEKGIVSEDVERIIFTTIAATGVISGIARGSNQTALAHKFYETTRFFFPESSKSYLHGELVGIGLLLQNAYVNETDKNIDLINLMKKYKMPHSLADIKVENSEENFEKYYNKICGSSSIDKNNTEECEKFKESLRYLWEMK